MVSRGGIRRSVNDLADITEDAPLSLSRAASASLPPAAAVTSEDRAGTKPAGTGAGERAGGFVAPRSVPLTLKLRQQATPRSKGRASSQVHRHERSRRSRCEDVQRASGSAVLARRATMDEQCNARRLHPRGQNASNVPRCFNSATHPCPREEREREKAASPRRTLVSIAPAIFCSVSRERSLLRGCKVHVDFPVAVVFSATINYVTRSRRSDITRYYSAHKLTGTCPAN